MDLRQVREFVLRRRLLYLWPSGFCTSGGGPDESGPVSLYRATMGAPSQAQPRRVFLETYGCQMNVADSELVSGVLSRHGYLRTPDPAEADVLLLNTCAIRERAEERVLGRLSELLRYKTARPAVQMGLLGCMASHLRDRLLDAAPYLDLIIGPDGYRDLPRLLEQGEDPRIDVRLDRGETYADLEPELAEGPRAWLTVMRGCDKFCTFCVVPFTRGRERSLPPDAVLSQVEAAVALGKREIVFLGQTVNAYSAEGVDFAALLRRAAAIDGLERIRFTSPHPSNVSDDLIEAFADEPKIMPYMHLPLQSASNGVLEAMARDYKIEEYRDLLYRFREAVPSLALSTDIIVGFPGEEERDFEETAAFLEEVRYDFAYLFKYSPREGTRAFKIPDSVSEEEKGRRLTRLIERQEQISFEKNRELIGAEVEVMVEGEARRNEGFVFGKSRNFKTTVFPDPGVTMGTVVRTRVESATAHTLKGMVSALSGFSDWH